MPKSTQQREELSVFRAFASLCPLGIDLDSIDTELPPHPDISCALKDGTRIAFELVESKDGTADRQVSGVLIPVLKYKVEEDRVRSALRSEFERACANGEIDDPKRFDGYRLIAQFADSANAKSRLTAVATVIQVLSQLGSGRHVVQHPVIRSVSCLPSVEKHKGLQFGEHSYATNAQASIVDCLKRKRHKLRNGHYEASYPIHLLVWSDTRIVDDSFDWEESAKELIADDGIQFADVWVYQSHERRYMKL